LAEKPAALEEAARAMGHSRALAERVNLVGMTPQGQLASTSYCLAAPGREYLVYQPKAGEPFVVEIKRGTYERAWFDPAKGAFAPGGRLESAGGAEQFKAPFDGEAILYLKAATGP